MKEPQKILEELIGSKPEKLTGEAKRLFEAIMKIADERDEFEYKYNRAIEDLIKLEKERQADKEKIKELKKFCKSKSTFQTFGDTELQKILETYINRLKHRILDILEE